MTLGTKATILQYEYESSIRSQAQFLYTKKT